MRTLQNLNFMIGEAWPITLVCNDANGDPIDLAGSNVTLRICDGIEILLQSDILTMGGIVVIDAAGGVCQAIVTEDMQSIAGLQRGSYIYEFRLDQPNGLSSSQAYGILYANAGQFTDALIASEAIASSEAFGMPRV